MKPNSDLARRIIPCLDVDQGKVVKGVRFRDHEVVGEIEDLALRYRDEGADELVLYDITASPQGRSVDRDWVCRVARKIDIPFCVAGGIRDVEAACEVLHSGADKISVNTPAIEDPELISRLAREFGSQCIVVGIDSHATESGYVVKKLTGDPSKTQDAGLSTLQWVSIVVELGAGEIVLNCINQDGARQGYDVEQLARVRAVCPIPLIASGGAGTPEHFLDVFVRSNVDGALAASVFHKSVIKIGELKSYLNQNGIPIRT